MFYWLHRCLPSMYDVYGNIQRIQYRIAMLVNKCLRGLASPYLAELCWPVIHLTSTPAVGRLRQTQCAMDSHSHWLQELCCFQSWDLEQFITWTTSGDTVHGHLRTTPGSASLRQQWMIRVCSASDFTQGCAIIIIIINVPFLFLTVNRYR